MKTTAQNQMRALRRKQEESAWIRHIWVLPALAAFGLQELCFHYIYFGLSFSACWFFLTLGWCGLLTAVAGLLPGTLRRVYLVLLPLVFTILAITHGIMLNMFRHFFSFMDMAYAGDGAAFAELSYFTIRKLAVCCALGCLLLGILAAILAPRRRVRAGRGPLAVFALVALASLALLVGLRVTKLKTPETVIWDYGANPGAFYADLSDTRAAMQHVGLYQYTLRDLWLSLGLDRLLDLGGRDDLETLRQWLDGREGIHEYNGMSGVLKGKNLILVQLEAIDTWMLTEKYMPELWALKQEGISFLNHYTPAYITAGTFNTELIVNTGLLPAGKGTPVSVYTGNEYPFSLAAMLREEGYTARSFHGSEGEVYARDAIHRAWGYEKYYGGKDMGMENYQMDSQLIGAYGEMTGEEPFFSFIITFSGHGPYNEYSTISQAHYEEALEIAERSEDNYVHAVAHAMETDIFVGELFDALEADGLLEDTALVFYADHYNYYMIDDPLNMEIKGSQNLDMLQHTDFFIWSSDIEPAAVDKITSTLDLLPTLCNMLALPADYASYAGHDAFSEGGGYVFFSSGAWFDGSYHLPGEQPEMDAEIALRRRMNGLILDTDWYSRAGN